jgi:predicted PurR-regulated permease PerM
MDRLGDFFREKTARRMLAIAIFLALIYLFREMFALVAMFVAAQAAFGGATNLLAARTKWPRKRAFFAVLGTFLLMLGGAIALGATRSLHYMRHAKHNFPEQLREMEENEIVKRPRELPDSAARQAREGYSSPRSTPSR